MQLQREKEIIETYWNVNCVTVLIQVNLAHRNNRNILECKLALNWRQE